MCTIIVIPAGVEPDYELIKLRYESNRDSWGLSYVKNGELAIVRRVGGDFDYLRQNISEAVRCGGSVVVHLRTATSGQEKDEGTQPIPVNGVAFFLNGNIKGYFGKHLPDTVLYAKDYIEKLPKGFLRKDYITNRIDQDATINNAVMVFMDEIGGIHIFNKQRGVWEKDMWFSNPRVGKYAGFGYSGVYPYKKGEKRYNI